MQLTIGSRALNLAPEVRKAMAAELRFVRMQRFSPVRIEFRRQRLEYWQEQAKATLHDFLTGKWVPASVTVKAAPTSDRIEKTDAERYEDRVIERECHTRNALRQMASYRHGGL